MTTVKRSSPLDAKWLSITYLIYVAFWEGLVWVGGVYLVIAYSWSMWTLAASVALSAMTGRPSTWRKLVDPEPNEE